MDTLFSGPRGEKLRTALLVVVALLGLFLFVQSVLGFMGLKYVGAGISPSNVITVSGDGDAYAVPDIGEFSYSVQALNKKTVSDAQTDVNKKSADITAYLKEAGIDEKDIKTINYSINPHYEWTQEYCAASMPCTPGKQNLTGYDVVQTNQVKVRDTAKAGDLLSGIGSRGATELSGLSFTTENPDAVQAEARNEAIAKAQSKAKELARSLGVSLVRVVSFNESNGATPYYRSMYDSSGTGAKLEAASVPAANISVGQNKVTSNVTITYEIR